MNAEGDASKMTLSDLQQEFGRLRGLWKGAWTGLPGIVDTCLRRLGHREPADLEPRLRAVHDCMQRVALAIEEDGRRRAREACEPAYHNRLHAADTLLSMTCLLLAARRTPRLPAPNGC